MSAICKHFNLPWQIKRIAGKTNYRLINFDNRNKVLKMNEVYFKHLVDEGKMAISFRYVQDINQRKVDRVFNFVRDVTENVEVSLNRIRNNLEKELTKKSKTKVKKHQPPPEEDPSENIQVRSMALISFISL